MVGELPFINQSTFLISLQSLGHSKYTLAYNLLTRFLSRLKYNFQPHKHTPKSHTICYPDSHTIVPPYNTTQLAYNYIHPKSHTQTRSLSPIISVPYNPAHIDYTSVATTQPHLQLTYIFSITICTPLVDYPLVAYIIIILLQSVLDCNRIIQFVLDCNRITHLAADLSHPLLSQSPSVHLGRRQGLTDWAFRSEYKSCVSNELLLNNGSSDFRSSHFLFNF